jgi:hypothetical protein
VHKVADEIRHLWAAQVQGSSLLIHAGETRPSSDVVSSCLRRYQGRVLTTEAGRWLLAQLGPISLSAVEHLLVSNAVSLSVYIFNSGWGYELDAKATAPDFPQALAEPQSTLDPDDPFSLVRLMPASLLGLPVTAFPFTRRCRNVLLQSVASEFAVPTLRDLLKYTQDDALRWRNFGTTSLEDLRQTLLLVQTGNWTPVAADAEQNAPSYIVRDTALSLFEGVRQSIDSFPATIQTVSKARLGVTGQRKTLAEIGATLGVSRERVRQLEAQAINEIEAGWRWPSELREKLDRAFLDRQEPLFVELLPKLDPWFEGVLSSVVHFERLLDSFTQCHLLETSDCRVVAKINNDQWAELLRTARSDLTQSGSGLTPDTIRDSLFGFAAAAGAPELTPLLVSELQPLFHFKGTGDSIELTGLSRTKIYTVQAILEEAETPLHYTKIAAIARERTGTSILDGRVLHYLSRIGCILFGRGTFGLRKHCPLAQEHLDALKDAAEYLTSEQGSDRQWHSAEILDLIQEYDDDLVAGVDKYLLGIALEASTVLQYKGRFVWGMKGAADAERRRIEIGEACAWILREAGRPLTTNELRTELRKRRGLGENFLMHPSREIARLSRNTWGLLERDFPTGKGFRELLLTAIHSVLVARGKGIHVSRLSEILHRNEIKFEGSGYQLLGIASGDSRFLVHTGDVIALSEWNGTRLLTVRQALQDLRQTWTEPLTLTTIQQATERSVERAVSRAHVYSVLRELGCQYDAIAGGWRPFSTDIGIEGFAVEESEGFLAEEDEEEGESSPSTG